MNLAIDCDGPIYPFVAHFRNYLRYEQDRSHEMPEPTKWFFADQWGMTKAEFLHFFHAFERSDFHQEAKPVNGAVKTIQALAADGHRITIVTARGADRNYASLSQRLKVQQETLAWLTRSGVDYHDIVFTKHKNIVKCDYLLDDAEHHLEEARAVTTPVCFMFPHNRDWKGLRVEGWCEFYDLLSEREGRKNDDQGIT